MDKRIVISLIAVALLTGGVSYALLQPKDNPKQSTNQPTETDNLPTASPAPAEPEPVPNNPAQSPEEPVTSEPSNPTPPDDTSEEFVTITENGHYKIRKRSATYYVTLYAIINSPDQYEQYRDQLRQYKKEANDYLSKSGVNLSSTTVKYEPEEANDL